MQTGPKSPAAELRGARRVNKVFNHISPPSPWPPPPTPPFQKPPPPIPISAPSQRPTQGCSNPRLKGAGGEVEGAARVKGGIGKGTALVCPPPLPPKRHCVREGWRIPFWENESSGRQRLRLSLICQMPFWRKICSSSGGRGLNETRSFRDTRQDPFCGCRLNERYAQG